MLVTLVSKGQREELLVNNTESDLIGNAVMMQFLEHDTNYDDNPPPPL